MLKVTQEIKGRAGLETARVGAIGAEEKEHRPWHQKD